MINITNSKQRARHIAEMGRLMDTLDAVGVKEFKPLINGQFIAVAKAIEQGMIGIDFLIDDYHARILDMFQRHYRRTATLFNRKATEALEGTSKSFVYYDSKSPKDEFWNALNSWIEIYGAQKVTQIQNTTKKIIADIIKKGMSEGLSNRDIAKKLRITGKITSNSRAMRIVRTETHTAAVKAVDESVASTRVKFEREWATARDERVRRPDKWNKWDHVGADGERTSQDGKFMKTGEALDFPGDPKGSAGNIIHCRCVLLYHAIRSITKRFYNKRTGQKFCFQA